MNRNYLQPKYIRIDREGSEGNSFPLFSDNISYDPLITEALLQCISSINRDIDNYKTLAKGQDGAWEEKPLINMVLDGIRHKKYLEDIYFRLSGERAPEMEKEKMDVAPVNPRDILREQMEREISNSEFIRSIYFQFHNRDIRDSLFEIINDKGHNAARLAFMLPFL